jgi:hypothetical protein
MPAQNLTFTNLLLVVVIVLLVANLAVPMLREHPEAPPPRETPDDSVGRRMGDIEAKLDLATREMRLAANHPVGAAPDDSDAIVVKVPAKIAEEYGLTKKDVSIAVRALAAVTKEAGRSMGHAREGANEVAAIATLRNCSSAQAQFQATAKADVDSDGTGEFGSFVELSGAKEVRGMRNFGRLNPPVLSGAFRNPSGRGVVSRSGYHFVIYLPSHDGEGVRADREGFGRISAEYAETTWCAYAWPVNYGESGRRTFMVNQTGDVVSVDDERYSGDRGPLPGAAYRDGGAYSIIGLTAIGVEGQDGNLWRQVN